MEYIVTAVAVVLTAAFALLNKLWTGFAYFVLATLMLLSIFWAVLLIYRYFTTFKKEQEENFKIYKANKINKTQITSEMFQQNLEVYKKDFNKKNFTSHVLKWCLIAFCCACALLFLFGMIWY